MPRLPTIRVIGSQAISTTSLDSLLLLLVVVILRPRLRVPSPGLLEAGGELLALAPPGRFLVHRLLGDFAQAPDRLAVDGAAARRQLGAGWLVHERHELVREPRH